MTNKTTNEQLTPNLEIESAVLERYQKGAQKVQTLSLIHI